MTIFDSVRKIFSYRISISYRNSHRIFHNFLLLVMDHFLIVQSRKFFSKLQNSFNITSSPIKLQIVFFKYSVEKNNFILVVFSKVCFTLFYCLVLKYLFWKRKRRGETWFFLFFRRQRNTILSITLTTDTETTLATKKNVAVIQLKVYIQYFYQMDESKLSTIKQIRTASGQESLMRQDLRGQDPLSTTLMPTSKDHTNL